MKNVFSKSCRVSHSITKMRITLHTDDNGVCTTVKDFKDDNFKSLTIIVSKPLFMEPSLKNYMTV